MSAITIRPPVIILENFSDRSGDHENILCTGNVERVFRFIDQAGQGVDWRVEVYLMCIEQSILSRGISSIRCREAFRSKLKSFIVQDRGIAICAKNVMQRMQILDAKEFEPEKKLLESMLKPRFINGCSLKGTLFSQAISENLGNCKTMSKAAAYLLGGMGFFITGLGLVSLKESEMGSFGNVLGMTLLVLGLLFLCSPFIDACHTSIRKEGV